MKSKQWKKIGILIMFLAVAAFALSGCSSGSDGATGATGETGVTGATGPTGPTGPSAGTDASKMTVAEVGTLLASSTATIDSVTIASAPVVKFTVKDANGNGITGLNIRNTSTPPGLKHLKFGIDKLVPGTNGSPSKWVNYIVTTPGNPAATPPVLPVATQPTTETQGALVDNGNGSYTYTFWHDLAKIKDTAGVTDVTYDPTLTHRLILTLTHNDAPEKFPLTVNKIVDFTIDPTTKAAIFIDETKGPKSGRDITTTEKCNNCHGNISKMFGHGYLLNDGGHFDTRPDVRNCISCHNDQMRINAASATSSNYVFPTLTDAQKANRRTAPVILDGEVTLDFPIMIHKLHMGNSLAKTNYWADGIEFDKKAYPQEIANCRGCHSGDTAAQLAAAPQGNNWKDKPSRLACGSCHDGINWATGKGKTVAGATTGHVGGPATSDALCYVCHDAVSIDTLYHVTINATPNNPSVPAGATNFTYEISSVTVGTGADLGKPIVKFRIMAVTPPATTATPVTFVKSVGGTAPLTGFTGAPSFLVAFADGTNTTVDFNNTGGTLAGGQPTSVSIAKLCDTSVSATATVGTSGTMTGPDASGYYTATLNQAATATLGKSVFPAGAKMRTVELQGYFTQVNPALARHAVMVTKTVTGDTARRLVVDSAKCAQCHEFFEGHGGNRNYNMDGCTLCHNPNLSSGGRTLALATPEATLNLKDMIHSMHGAGMRANDYQFGIVRLAGMFNYNYIVWPGILQNCETCHKPGTYGAVPAGALATTNVTTSNTGATIATATNVVTNAADTLANVATARLSLPNTADLVITPYAAACVSCHDSDASKAHMTANGGKINKGRGTVIVADEQCVVCHGAGRSADAAAVHLNLVPGN